MIKYISLFLMLLIAAANVSKAQRHEFGIGGGAMNYAGDMIRGYSFSNVTPGGQVYYRYIINPIISARGALSIGKVSGSDQNPFDAFTQLRNERFSVNVTELSADFEFNFLDIKSQKTLNTWTPYLFFGFGVFYYNGDLPESGINQGSKIQPVLPFGGGFKFDLNKNLSLSAEMGVRKLFTDWFDGISDNDITNKNNRQYGNKHDLDWYNFFAVTISYTLYSNECPYDFY